LESLLVADNLDIRIVFLDKGDRTAMVRFHVIDDQIIDRAIAYHLMDMLDELGEKVNFNGIYQTHLLIVNEIRVITHAIG
jgi:hypothetical protein